MPHQVHYIELSNKMLDTPRPGEMNVIPSIKARKFENAHIRQLLLIYIRLTDIQRKNVTFGTKAT